MNNAVDERGNSYEEAHEWSGGANVKERASVANRGTDEDEGAERADQRGERNEERIAGMNVVVAAGEKMAEFVGEQDGQERQGEGESGGEGERLAIDEREGMNEFVPGDGFVVGVGDGEMSAGDEAGAKRQEK